MKWLCLIFTLVIAVQASAELQPHTFNYSGVETLEDHLEFTGIVLKNCEECEPLNISDYTVKGIEELLAFNGKDRGLNLEWQVGANSMVVDYHFNFLYVLRLEQRGSDLAIIQLVKSYPVSNGLGGVGNNPNTQATPPGIHYIWKKQNSGPDGAIWPINFVIDAYKAGRRAGPLEPTTGPYRWPNFKESLSDGSSKRRSWQFVTTRILRMRGLQDKNSNSEKGSKPLRRSILIHGTNEEGLIGVQASLGCVRMINADIIELYEMIDENTLVNVTFVEDHWQSAAGKKRVGRPNNAFWLYKEGVDFEPLSLEEADKRWVKYH